MAWLGGPWTWGEVGDNGFGPDRGGSGLVVGFNKGFERLAGLMSKVKATLDNTPLFIAMAVVLVLLSAAHFWPSSYWFDVRAVKAGPATVGQPIPMIVDRTIKRSFVGEWTVTVKRFVSIGWVNYCHGSGRAHYQAGSELPIDLDMKWWTGGACEFLPEGKYVIETSWSIQPPASFIPSRQVYATSNIFEVTP